ncbi:MAG: hypothetical protein M0R06_22990 [Sphaerochaeta sp.]|jgi:hypothetical protein|nr:hypothetical protein [Sphaerochaeta sp.]
MPRGKRNINPEHAALLSTLKLTINTLKAGAKRIDTETLEYDISAYKVGKSVRIDIKPKEEAANELPI